MAHNTYPVFKTIEIKRKYEKQINAPIKYLLFHPHKLQFFLYGVYRELLHSFISIRSFYHKSEIKENIRKNT